MKYVKAGKGNKIVRQDYSKEIIFDVNDLPGNGHMLQTVIIPPNTKQRNHSHDVQTEIFYILRGECSIFINEKEYIAKPGDSFVCEQGDEHYLWNKSDEEFELVVFKIDRPQDNEDTNWND
jgi:quercetin dioxygenase-like cupin family protein